MKLLRIEVENLNSLYGRHAVDFEGALGGAPLILITGPTGAGKSTLLDAVGLALFGRTPRLTSPRSDDASLDARSILSRGAAEASAAVEFLKREGSGAARYRASWSCKRAHKRPDGALQSPVRTLERFDAAAGAFVPLASDARAAYYQPHFDRVLEGLSAADFQRSMLLAQGEFSAFLKADADERVRLLERLTATERFRSIGERAAQTRAAAQEAFEHAERELSGIALLSDAERGALAGEAARLLEQSQRLRGEAARAGAALAWLSQRAEHRRRLDEQSARARRAREALAAQEPELARLAEHERCAPAGQALRELERAARDADRSRQSVERLRVEVRESGAQLERAMPAASRALAARDAAAQRLASEGASIARAREIRTRLRAAEAELKSAGAERLRAQATAAERRRREREALEHQRAQEAGLKDAERRSADLAPWQPLVAALAGFEARNEALRAADRELRRSAERLEARRLARDDAAARLVDAEGRTARRRSEAQAAGEALEAAAAALSAALGPARDARERRAALSSGLEAALEREAGIKALAALELQRAELARRTTDLSAELTRAREGCQRASEAGPRLERALREQREEQERIAAEVEDLRFLLGMARERGRLRSGEPCPLCGSERHPHIEDPRFAELDLRTETRAQALEARRADLAGQAEMLQREQEATRLQAADLRARLDALGPERDRQVAQLAALQERLCASLGELGLRDAGELEAAAAAAAGARAELQVAVRVLEGVEARWLAAQSSRHEASALLAEAAQAEGGARAELDSRGRALQEAEDELSRLRGQHGADRETLAAELQACGAGSGRAELAELDASLASARRRAGEVTAGDAKLQAAKAGVFAASAAALEAGAHAQAAAERFEALEAAERERAAEAAALRAQAAEVLSGEDPDIVEGRLQKAAEAAAQAFQEAQAACAALQASLAGVRGRLEVESGRWDEAEQQRADRRAALDAALSGIGLGLTSAAELKERLLPPEEEARLAALRQALRGDERAAAELLASRAKDLEELESKRPVDLAPDAEEPRLREALGDLERRVDELERQRHAVGARLDEDAARRAAHAERAARRDALRQELDIWERLHALIGVREGQQFQRFAQLLNLEELVRKANARLERIAPRYRLVPARDARGERLLAFAVQDEWHGGVERPVTTLSGGESFLVSLALALALADYRAVRMPIETLLLDEGFGALDRETLGVAMSALSALTSEGVQVALISHVEWLRDQIEAQVSVEPCGNGRSRVAMTVAGRALAASEPTAGQATRSRAGPGPASAARARSPQISP